MQNIGLIATATAILGCFAIHAGHAQQPHKRLTEVHVEGATAVPVDAVSGPLSSAKGTAVASPNDAAPALSRMFINNVCSTTACETISSGQLATSATYTGSSVYVYVWEIGYGSGETASQGGFPLSNSYLVGEQSVCQSGNYYTTPCPTGATVLGWRYEWNIGPFLSNGDAENFAAQDTSVNPPHNTLYTNLQINYQH